MSRYKVTIFLKGPSGTSTENFYNATTTDTLQQTINKVQQLLPLRAAMSYGNPDKTGVAPKSPMKISYLRIEDDLIKRDGRVIPINMTCNYPNNTNTIFRSTSGNWPQIWRALHQVYAAPAQGQGVWALWYFTGVPMEGTNWVAEQDVTLQSKYSSLIGIYLNALKQANFGFKSYSSYLQSGVPGVQLPVAPQQVAYDLVTERYIFTVSWTNPPVTAVSTNRFTAVLKGFRNLGFLNGYHPMQFYGLAPITNIPQYILSKGRYPNVAWDTTGFIGPVTYRNVPLDSWEFKGMHRRKVGRDPFVPRGRARVVRA